MHDGHKGTGTGKFKFALAEHVGGLGLGRIVSLMNRGVLVYKFSSELVDVNVEKGGDFTRWSELARQLAYLFQDCRVG